VALAYTRDSRRALSASADGSLRLWHLDWEPQIRAFSEWDDRAKPHLEVFLAQHTPRGARGALRPEWTDHDLSRLVSDLRHRGLGWIRPDGIRNRLQQMTEQWQAPPPPEPLAAPGERRAIAATPHARLKWRKQTKRALIAATVGIPILILAGFLHSYVQLHFDSATLRARRGSNFTILQVPVMMARPTECDPKQLDRYIRDFTGFTDSPKDWSAALYCLEYLGDPRAVSPLLDVVRPKKEPEGPTELQIGSDRNQVLAALRQAKTGGVGPRGAVQAMLARIGERAIPKLVDAMEDPERAVREVAAGALALGASEGSIEALLAQAEHPKAEVRQAVAKQLQSIACSKQLEIEESFELARELAGDEDPEVRLRVARAVAIFAGTKARTLASSLAEDPDPKVREAAKKLLE
jgi:hypothetical protein